MTTRLRGVILAVSAATLVLVGASCQKPAPDTRLEAERVRVRKAESAITKLTGLTDQMNAQLLVLQGKDEATSAEIATLRGSLAELKEGLASVGGDLKAARGDTTELSKKLDSLSAKLSAVDQRLWVLDAKYTDHLRKYHGG